jgi:hypothetical protein
LAEVLAQNWGNLQFGIRELSQRTTPNGGVSEVQAFAWDLETNTLQSKTFQVEHVRFTRKDGKKRLTDPRDIYELIANQGARRLRACILGVIPGDITEEAVKQCEKTMESGDERPLVERIRSMVLAFEELGVTQEVIEKRLGHNVDATIATEIVTLQKIFRSIKDGMAKPEDFFDLPREDFKTASDLQDKLDSKEPPDPRQFLCPHCSWKSATERGLKKHITQQHADLSAGDSTAPLDSQKKEFQAISPKTDSTDQPEPEWWPAFKKKYDDVKEMVQEVFKDETNDKIGEILENHDLTGVDELMVKEGGQKIGETLILRMRSLI